MNLKVLVILFVSLCCSSALVKRSPFHYEYKDKLYYFETFYKASFFKAFMTCCKMGMNLLSIESDEEFDIIHSIVKDKMEYKHDLMIWSSGVMKEKGQFYWMNTGNPVRLKRWHPNQPNYSQEKQYCLQLWLDKTKFLLNDFNCEKETYFICDSK